MHGQFDSPFVVIVGGEALVPVAWERPGAEKRGREAWRFLDGGNTSRRRTPPTQANHPPPAVRAWHRRWCVRCPGWASRTAVRGPGAVPRRRSRSFSPRRTNNNQHLLFLIHQQKSFPLTLFHRISQGFFLLSSFLVQ